MLNLNTPIQNIPRVTEKYARALKKLGIETARDLLMHFPFRYDDFSKIVPVSPEYVGQTITIAGIVQKAKLARIFRRRLTIAEIVLHDEKGTPLKAAWFNQPYILDTLKVGTALRLSGKLEFKGRTFSMTGPAWERAGRDATNTGILVPVYPETKGLSSKWLRWQLKTLLAKSPQLTDPLPTAIRKKLNLYNLPTALRQIHFPENREKLLRAQKRFAFEEMFLVQLKALQVKLVWQQEKSTAIAFDENLIKKFVTTLPFKLTDAQRKASFEILRDLEKKQPMNRLLNGDVGSGKTVVAAIAALQAVNAGYQVAVMAPTEVLAKQHFESFCKLFANYDFNIALLTNSYQDIKNFNFQISNFPASAGSRQGGDKSSPDDQILKSKKTSKENLIVNLKNGAIDLVVGTHALIQESVKFKNLALLIVDEQHRFGVAQRAYLQQEIHDINDPENPAADHGASGIKNKVPHLLSMTATPIPRTLSLAFFGNLDLSILDEMPKNRKKIITKIINPVQRQKTYDFIRAEIKNGRQVFIILPLVEDSKVLTEVKAAVSEHQRLSEEIFPDLRLGLLHGKLKSAEKESVMQEFSAKKLDILVSTSVIEVGIDIPNATVIVIEDADRFGLSQLHQFRGRVGRGAHQSYCFLFTASQTAVANNRLRALEETNDGFKIAERDLQLRGPGEFFGTRQSGLPDIAMENLANVKLIQVSRQEAVQILRADPALQDYPTLAAALQKFSAAIHME